MPDMVHPIPGCNFKDLARHGSMARADQSDSENFQRSYLQYEDPWHGNAFRSTGLLW